MGFVDAADATVGTATCEWSYNIGSGESASYTVGIVVGGYYSRFSSGGTGLWVEYPTRFSGYDRVLEYQGYRLFSITAYFIAVSKFFQNFITVSRQFLASYLHKSVGKYHRHILSGNLITRCKCSVGTA